MKKLITSKKPISVIRNKRNKIADKLISLSNNINSRNLRTMVVEDLELLFKLYDIFFFNNWFNLSFTGEIKFSLSSKMTSSAGKLISHKNSQELKLYHKRFEIRMSTDFFLLYDAVKGKKIVCGIETDNNLKAYQIVFEHELCHLLEMIIFNKSSCKGDKFRTIAQNIFAHTESTHGLPTYRDIALHKFGIKTGDKVSFNFKNNKLYGRITRITKRATVMVENNNGDYRDETDQIYAKYYVPIQQLTKV